MGACCAKTRGDDIFENVVVLQMARSAAGMKVFGIERRSDPLLDRDELLDFEKVYNSDTSHEYDREELMALLRSDGEY